jgi:DNA-binding response OmpR family regulator
MRRVLDPFTLSYIRGRREVQLTPGEYRIMFVLAHGEGSPAELAELLGQETATIKAHVCNLRRKLVAIGEKGLRTCGGSYRFEFDMIIASRFLEQELRPVRIGKKNR